MTDAYANCPFCGGPATFKDIPVDVYSGVQKPDVTIGCAACDYWFPSEPQEKFIKDQGVVAVDPMPKLRAKWQMRTGR